MTDEITYTVKGKEIALGVVVKRAEQMLRDRRDRHCSCHWHQGKLCGVHALEHLTSRETNPLLYTAVHLTATAWGVPDSEAHEWATIAT